VAVAKTMDVFSLRDSVVNEYRAFATSFTTIHAPDLKQKVDALYGENRFWPEPLLQINPSYRRETDVQKLVDAGELHPACASIFCDDKTKEPLTLYQHQKYAVALANSGASYVVTTGTGSGKSLCFFVPIVSAVLKARAASPGKRTRAIIIYPMNALANSQMEELEKYMDNVPGQKPVTYDRYTGQEEKEERERIAKNPPDILLTNFMMLELLMTRQDPVDRQVMENCRGLQFLVLDELHTYRGRQGADVALLVRRVRERLAPDALQCIGTSATMASQGTTADKRRVVARVASKLFATDVPENNVVTETLERVTDANLDAIKVKGKLAGSIAKPVPKHVTDEELKTNPLAIWVETTLGIRWSDDDKGWVRAHPLSLTEAAAKLSEESGSTEEACKAALRDFLLQSSIPEEDRIGKKGANTRAFFAFKLHQFLSGAGNLYGTLEPPGARVVTVEPQQFHPDHPQKRLYAVHFCRNCGHEYHPVRRVQKDGQESVLARDIDDALPRSPEDEDEPIAEADQERLGFVTLNPQEQGPEPLFLFADADDDYPEAWLEFDGNNAAKLKSPKGRRVERIQVQPTGELGSGGVAWFIPNAYRFCLRCGDMPSPNSRDRNKLASLSSEGRSSATTVLVGSVLRWMHGKDSFLDEHQRKLLAFTDNRQDAALQAGHFNDFVFVSLVRAAFLGALQDAPAEGLRSADLGMAQQKALGFDRKDGALRSEWLLDPGMKGHNLLEAEKTLRQVLSYRVWFDQRRGWRFTNPNLQQLNLLRVEFSALGKPEEAEQGGLIFDEPCMAGVPALSAASPAVRSAVFRTLFNHLRQWMAIKSIVLEPHTIEQLVASSHNRLRPPWGFGDEKPRSARWLMVQAPSKKGLKLRDDDMIVRAGKRSALGKALCSLKLWDGSSIVKDLKPKEFDQFILALLNAAKEHGLVTEDVTPFDSAPGWRLVDEVVSFHLNAPAANKPTSPSNKFFTEYYFQLATMLKSAHHPLFGMEAREHTAQVDQEKRQAREKRFRFGAKEKTELADDEKALRDMGESNRFLPVMFCSPTMELGVDISALNAVYLRNVPPTPANYAQRSGRAGRSGQAALVLSYCASRSPHDQYFFREPKNMVHGEVRAPLLDLANRDLVTSHLHAVWLAATEQELDPSISELLVLKDPERPLKDDVAAPMKAAKVTATATDRMKRVLDSLSEDLKPEAAPWYPGRDAFAALTAQRAAEEFGAAFKRWRDLFRAAEAQRDTAHKITTDYSASPHEKRHAERLYHQAQDQLGLLQQGTSKHSSDFYTYRYLATEGFLPGYNFPRLPLMAYIPATQDGRGRQAYLQRPRFLALSEFGPRSLVYHEGRAFRVVRAMLSLGNATQGAANVFLPTYTFRICTACGAGHLGDTASLCHSCQQPLGDAEVVHHIFRIENVATQPAERITANDEERQRQGFELQTTFQWAMRDNQPDVRRGASSDGAGEVLKLFYGPGATITRLNKGLRRRANQSEFGFRIDPVSGFWAKAKDEDQEAQDPTANPRQWIVPSVQDRKNALLLQPVDQEWEQKTFATVQHALLRGIESVFQLEEGEVLAEPMPDRDERTGFLLYEATEGGAGVLTQLVSDSSRLADVAINALKIMHLDVQTTPLPQDLQDQAGTHCVAACYRCLMSYYNQPDHELLDRRDADARQFLRRLALGETHLAVVAAAPVTSVATAPSKLEDICKARLMALGLPPPDAELLRNMDGAVPLAWRSHYVAAALKEPPAAVKERLEALGFVLVVLGEDEKAWDAPLKALSSALGK